MTIRSFSDTELIEMVQSGDEYAFNLLYERYVKLVYYIAYRFCKNDADSQDVVQETFLQLKHTITDLKNPSLFKYWLNKITISKCKNLFRKNRYVTYDDEHYEAKNNLLETRKDVQPAYLLKFDSDKDMMNAFIDELPQGQKDVVILHYLEQFSVEEVADLLQLPQGTIKSRLSYARATLRRKIEQYEKENDTKLNFHSLDAGIAGALAASFIAFQMPKIATKHKTAQKKGRFSQLAANVSVKLILSAVVCLAGGVGVYAWMQNDGKQKEDRSVSHLAEDEINTFPKIVIRDKEITSARSAYYTIKTWACCKTEMEMMDVGKLQDVYHLYQVMKKNNSVYYQDLVAEQWVRDLENVYQKRIR